MALYRGMDRAALDAAYNNGAAIGAEARARIFADWEARSAAQRGVPGAALDLRYGTGERNRIDFLPAPGAAGATLVFLHGGYWQANAKESFAFIAAGPRAHGMNVALVGYTLAPEASLDVIVAEIRGAIGFLRAQLPSLGGDPVRILLSGWSAGGHLVAAALGEPGIAAGLAISGIYDLEPMRLCYINEKLGLDAEAARRNSPLLHLPEASPPLVVAVGGGELAELRRQSAEFAAARRAKGLQGDFVELPGLDHYAVLEELARPDGRLARIARDLTR